MAQGPVEAAKMVELVIAINSPPRRVVEVLTEIILLNRWSFGNEAVDQAEFWLERFVSRVQFIIDTSQEAGRHVSFTFNSSGLDYIQGSCYPEPSDPENVVRAKLKRSRTYDIFKHCQSLRPVQIEQLCGKILKLLKVERPFVSRQSADQGIDFFGRVLYGELLMPSFLSPGAEKHIAVWLVGQAKHYPDTKIGTGDIRQLVGSVELARAKVFVGKTDPLSELTCRLCDPVIYLFFTTGTFSRDSLELLAKSGVLAFDGLQIGQFLADHGVGMVEHSFHKSRFNQWLAA